MSCRISICIPAYKQPALVRRLLDSIAIQTCRDFEVIVTDDTPGNEVQGVCQQYADILPLAYHKNPQALGTPENWNKCIGLATGQWIKLMHQDDWFAKEDSLQQFFAASIEKPGVDFIFSAYRNIYEDKRAPKNIALTSLDKKRLLMSPAVLLAANFIGPPSVVLHKNNPAVQYDKQLKWLVDMDFYIRYPGVQQAHYIVLPLVCIGVHGLQVTATAFGNSAVEIPEYLYELNKLGTGILRNLVVFDAYWRMIRNFKIRNEQAIRASGFHGNIPRVITSMLHFQQWLPDSLLRVGLFSKLCMAVCYLYNRFLKKGRL